MSWRSRAGLLLAILAASCSSGCSSSGPLSKQVDISEVNASPWTAKTRQQLQGLLNRYDLTPFLFTRQVQIQTRVIPHPKPVLTLDTYFADRPDALLAVFLHQQMEWFLDRKPDRVQSVLAGLRKAYPDLPRGTSEVASTPEATYHALIAAWLEVEAARRFLGGAQADAVVSSFTFHRWIYRTVIDDHNEIGALMRSQDLVPSPL